VVRTAAKTAVKVTVVRVRAAAEVSVKWDRFPAQAGASHLVKATAAERTTP